MMSDVYLPLSHTVRKLERQRELEEAAAAAAAADGGRGGGGSTSSRSGGPRRVALGADDLLPALTWVVVQVSFLFNTRTSTFFCTIMYFEALNKTLLIIVTVSNLLK